MNTVSFTLADFTPRFRGDGYVMSYVTQTVLRTRLIRLDAGDGRVGYGESVSDPGFDASEVAALEGSALAGIVDMTLDDVPALTRRLKASDDRLSGLAFGLETAYFDLLTRADNNPLHALLGGRKCDDVPDYLSLSCGEPEVMAARIRSDGSRREVIQIKLDGRDMDTDVSRIGAVMAVLLPHQTLLVDFNGALSPDAARTMFAEYSDSRIMWEEPCPSYEENRDLVDTTGAQVLFDQCLKSPAVFTRACADGAMKAACIKPAMLGGLDVARVARDTCTDSGIAVRVDGLWCGPVATAATLHLAVGTPPDLLIAGCDLREPLVLDEDWGGIIRTSGDRIAPADEPGHGVVPPANLWQAQQQP